MAEVNTRGRIGKHAALITLSFSLLAGIVARSTGSTSSALGCAWMVGPAWRRALAFVVQLVRPEFWQFAQAARVELRKVVWPSREETIKTTWSCSFSPS
jgi:hypothetical protein